MNDSVFLKACRQESTSHTPIWLMRQIGRYMKEYRDLRKRVGFLELCKSPELVCEATVTAVRKIGPDAAIIFSDILLILEVLGFDLDYVEGRGPVISNPLKGPADLDRMKEALYIEDPLPFVGQAIALTKQELGENIPVIGFSGAPFTVSAYAIEGGSSKTFEKTKAFMRNQPQTWNQFLEVLTVLTGHYLNQQIRSGAKAIQVFDSWVGFLSREEYETHVWPHTKALIASLPKDVPIIHFGTQTEPFLDLLSSSGAHVIGLDATASIGSVMSAFPSLAFQGNLDPQILLTSRKEIEQAAQKILDEVRGRPGHIFNLGHGVLPPTPVDHVVALIEYVHEKSSRS